MPDAAYAILAPKPTNPNIMKDGKRKRKAKEAIDFVPTSGRRLDMRKGEVDDVSLPQ